MNEVLKTIKERFSCRSYTGDPVPTEKLDQIVTAALQAPTAIDAQRFRLIVITNKKLIEELDAQALELLKNEPNPTTYERIKSRGGAVYYNAPCMIIILKETDNAHGIVDSGVMVQTIALAASSLDINSVICAMANIPFWPKNEKADELKKKIGWQEGYDFAMGILLGQGNTTKEPHTLHPEKVHYVK